MSDLKKIIVWFLVCLVLAVYAKSAGFVPGTIGPKNTTAVLGQQTFSGK